MRPLVSDARPYPLYAPADGPESRTARWGTNTGGLIIPPNSKGGDRYGPNFQFVNPGKCPWDLDGTGNVGASDPLALLVSWGPCKGCPADFDNNGAVGAYDLLALLVNWGPCP